MNRQDEITVLLCNCNGRTGARLSLADIDAFVHKIAPQAHVVHADTLCEVDSLNRHVRSEGQAKIIGACPRLKPESRLWNLVHTTTGNAQPLKIIDLLEDVIEPYDTESMTERIKLRIAAQISAITSVKNRRTVNADLSFTVPHGQFDRRRFLQVFVPKPDMKPAIDNLKCTDALNCKLCQKSCLFDAVHINEDGMIIDKSICTGCGACVLSCPCDAIYQPGYSPEQLDSEVAGLLHERTKLTPKLLALVCRNCISSNNGLNDYRYPVNVLPVEIPCLGMVSPVLLLSAFAEGVHGLIVLYNDEQCRDKVDTDRLTSNIHFIQALLRRWNIEPERIEMVNTSRGTTPDIESRLLRFSDYIAQLPAIDLKVDDRPPFETKEARLSSFIKEIETQQGPGFKGRIATGNVPFGKLTLNKDECTGCGLCAGHCPVNALTFEHDGYRILFNHELCNGCGLCADICPQQCISVERVLQFEDLVKEPELLFQDNTVSCRICGTPFTSRSLIREVKSKLNLSGTMADNLEICSDCKLRLHRSYQHNELQKDNHKQEIRSGA